MREFNKRLSSARIISEHAFGRLKGRFPGLKDLGTHRDVQDMYKAIEAMLVLHNICIEWQDHPQDIIDFNPRDDFDEAAVADPPVQVDMDTRVYCQVIEGEAEIPEHETDLWMKEQGHLKRKQILDRLFPPT